MASSNGTKGKSSRMRFKGKFVKELKAFGMNILGWSRKMEIFMFLVDFKGKYVNWCDFEGEVRWSKPNRSYGMREDQNLRHEVKAWGTSFGRVNFRHKSTILGGLQNKCVIGLDSEDGINWKKFRVNILGWGSSEGLAIWQGFGDMVWKMQKMKKMEHRSWQLRFGWHFMGCGCLRGLKTWYARWPGGLFGHGMKISKRSCVRGVIIGQNGGFEKEVCEIFGIWGWYQGEQFKDVFQRVGSSQVWVIWLGYLVMVWNVEKWWKLVHFRRQGEFCWDFKGGGCFKRSNVSHRVGADHLWWHRFKGLGNSCFGWV